MIAYLVKGSMVSIDEDMPRLLKAHGLGAPNDIEKYLNSKFHRTLPYGTYPSNEERKEWALTFYREVFKESLKEAELKQIVSDGAIKGLSMEISQDGKQICISELTSDQVIGRDKYMDEVTLDITDLSIPNLCKIAEKMKYCFLHEYQKLDNIMSVVERECCAAKGIHIKVFKAASSYIIGYPVMKTQSVSSSRLCHTIADEFVLNWFLDYYEKEEDRTTFLILSDEKETI